MERTQISLTEEQKRWLEERAAESGLSLAELIRRAIDQCYAPGRDVETDLAAIREARGTWKDRDFDGADYVARLRRPIEPR